MIKFLRYESFQIYRSSYREKLRIDPADLC